MDASMHSRGHGSRTPLALRLGLALLVALTGCAQWGLELPDVDLGGGGSSLTLQSRWDGGGTLHGAFDEALYRFEEPHGLTVVLVAGPVDQPSQVATIRVFWRPVAGHTPINPDATNAAIHYVVFAGEEHRELGVYGGAGYAYPRGRPGAQRLTLEIWDADVRLADRSVNFRDLLGPAVLSGRLSLRRDDARVRELLRQVSERLGRDLDYPRLVVGPPVGAAPR